MSDARGDATLAAKPLMLAAFMAVNQKSHACAEMMDEIQCCCQELKDIVSKFAEKLNVMPRPSTLYHFTNDSGLRGIVKSGKIWTSLMAALRSRADLGFGSRFPATD